MKKQKKHTEPIVSTEGRCCDLIQHMARPGKTAKGNQVVGTLILVELNPDDLKSSPVLFFSPFCCPFANYELYLSVVKHHPNV